MSTKAPGLIKHLIPSNSPIGQTIEENKRKEEEQLATDEANNLVMQREEAPLPGAVHEMNAIAQGNIPQVVPAQQIQPQEAFVNPGEAKASRSPADLGGNIPSLNNSDYGRGLDMEASELARQGKQESDAYQTQINAINQTQQDLQKLNQQKQEEEAKLLLEKDQADRSANAFKYEKKNFFSGKSTWEKVLGGVGMFLGSLTPEGAKNVAKIIESEIDRDLKMQEREHQILKDKASTAANSLASLEKKYGSRQVALLQRKNDMLEMVKARLSQIEANSKGGLARAKAQQGKEAIDMKVRENNLKSYELMRKVKQEEQDGRIPGYEGVINDATAARQMREQISEMPGIKSEIRNLLDINNKFLGGALSTDARASAQQSQNMLIGKLRVMIVGPGAVNESEYKLLRDAISNPTDFFSLKSSNSLKLKQLEKAIDSKVQANLSAYGLKKTMPQGAREIK